ncbi:MAG TPA: hypothetical protein VGK34_08440 [Armatimonadota bacterium]
MFLVFVLILAVVLVITYAIFTAQDDERRGRELLLLSDRLKLEFYQEDVPRLALVYGYFDCLLKGDSGRASNVMTGQFEGFQINMFDYQYSTGSGRSRETHELSIVAFDTDMLFVELFIRPENMMDKVAATMGFDDINFESDEFNRAIYVKSQDKKFAYDVITTTMMEFLLANQGWSIQMRGRTVIVYNGQLLSADEFLDAANFTREFIQLLPEYLVQTLRGEVTH